MPELVPDYVRRVSNKLSDYTLAKIRGEWDRMCVYMAKPTCIHPDPTKIWEWEVCVNSSWHIVDDINWKCTCEFNTSLRLPCKHIMFIARECHKFSMLPVSVISDRSCMNRAARVLSAIQDTHLCLQSVRDLARLAPRLVSEATDSATKGTTTDTATDINSDNTGRVGSARDSCEEAERSVSSSSPSSGTFESSRVILE